MINNDNIMTTKASEKVSTDEKVYYKSSLYVIVSI